MPGSPDDTGCGRCGSMEHKGADCPQNPRNRFQQGGFQSSRQQGGYSQGYQQVRFAQGGGGGFQQQPRFQGAGRGAFVRIQPQGAAGHIMPRAPGAPARPQGVYVVDSTGQLVPQEEQGAESGAGVEGKPGGRSRRGSQQRARDVVREGIEDLKAWENKSWLRHSYGGRAGILRVPGGVLTKTEVPRVRA